jgi:hypothetical protein
MTPIVLLCPRRDMPAVEDLENASFVFDGSIRGLIKNLPHLAIAFGERLLWFTPGLSSSPGSSFRGWVTLGLRALTSPVRGFTRLSLRLLVKVSEVVYDKT